MGRFKPGHEFVSNNNVCCCGPLVRVTARTPVRTCFPVTTRSVSNICLPCSRINPSVRFKKRNLKWFKKRNLKRMEPKDEDDGELEDTKDEEGDDAEAPISKFAGKKKVVSNNALNASSFGLLGRGGDEDNEDSGITKRMLVMKNQDNQVSGFAPYKKRKLGTHKRAKKRKEMEFVLQKMRVAGGGEKKK